VTEKIQLIDTSKCTGCRGCQVACKQWNQLPAGLTMNKGTYQNPPDLQKNTWTLVRFQEVSDRDGGVQWLFRKDGCLHCTDATCVKLCPAEARFRLESGAIGTANEKCIGCQQCVDACPFSKPRYEESSNKAYKCNLCAERTQNNLPPACVKACPTGALRFGDKEAMLEMAYKRVRELGKNASVYGDKFFGGTHLVYVLEEKVAVYDALPANPKVMASVFFWKAFKKPFGILEAGAGLAVWAVSSFFQRRSDLDKHRQNNGG
jgi:formate dehydrogenase iron-sulfur subunit